MIETYGELMNKKELNSFKVFFEEQIKNISSKLDAKIEVDVSGDDVDKAQGDAINQISKNMSLRNIKKVNDIKNALQRIEQGTFGYCEDCGEKIGEKRLKVKPDATMCISCAEAYEREMSQHI